MIILKLLYNNMKSINHSAKLQQLQSAVLKTQLLWPVMPYEKKNSSTSHMLYDAPVVSFGAHVIINNAHIY